MSSENPTRQEIDADKMAAGNPRVDAVKFKEWRRKMERIERLGLNQNVSGDPPPRQTQPIGMSGRFKRSENLAR